MSSISNNNNNDNIYLNAPSTFPFSADQKVQTYEEIYNVFWQNYLNCVSKSEEEIKLGFPPRRLNEKHYVIPFNEQSFEAWVNQYKPLHDEITRIWKKTEQNMIFTLKKVAFIPTCLNKLELQHLVIYQLQGPVEYSKDFFANRCNRCLSELTFENTDLSGQSLSPLSHNTLLNNPSISIHFNNCNLNNASIRTLLQNHTPNYHFFKNEPGISIKPVTKEQIKEFAKKWETGTWLEHEKETIDLWLLLHQINGEVILPRGTVDQSLPCLYHNSSEDEEADAFSSEDALFHENCEEEHGWAIDVPQTTIDAISGKPIPQNVNPYDLPDDEEDNDSLQMKKVKIEKVD